jgi:hypothetical protein
VRRGARRKYIEKMSGAVTNRRVLLEVLDYARSGDTLIVWKLDRLAYGADRWQTDEAHWDDLDVARTLLANPDIPVADVSDRAAYRPRHCIGICPRRGA